MQAFGIVYLFAYLIDCGMAMAATLDPSLAYLSNLISMVVVLCTIAVFALSLARSLPRLPFLVVSGYFFAMLIFNAWVASILFTKLGKDFDPAKITNEIINKQFPWYEPVNWLLLAPWLSVALWGVRTVFRPPPAAGAMLATQPPDPDS